MDELKKRKTIRLKGADYNRNSTVFLTICTKERRCILSHVVGTGVPDGPSIHGISNIPRIELTEYGMNIWQARSFDHIIRNYNDYEEHRRYIYENPIRWYYDELYSEE